MNSIARLLSFVLYPMLIPIYLLFFIFKDGSLFSQIPLASKLYCYIITISVFLLIPLISMYVLRQMGVIKNYRMKYKRDQIYLIFIILLFALLGFWLLTKIAYFNIVGYMYTVVLMSFLASYTTSFFQKIRISIHMTAMGVACGFIFVLGYKFFGDVRGSLMLVLFLSGLLASSQLYLKQHSPFQVGLGFLMGLCVTSGGLF